MGSEMCIRDSKFTSKTTKSGFHQFHLQSVQVTSLVEYDAPDSEVDDTAFETVKGGYTASSVSEEDAPF